MENRNNDKLVPNVLFWEAVFSSFRKINLLANEFTELKGEPENENFPLSKLFYDLYNNHQLSIKKIPELLKKVIITKNRQDLFLNPRQLFNFILEELHNELILLDNNNKVIKREKIISNELENTIELFDKYEKNNKSFLQKLFFGRKQITKECQECKSTAYELEFLKFCPIDIRNVKGFVEIEKLYENIQREFEKVTFCQNCNKNTNFKMKIDIINEPKILILFIFNYKDNIKIDFSNSFYDKYKIKSIIMGTESALKSFFCCSKNKDFVSYGKDGKGFYIFDKGDIKYIKEKELDKGNPYIIFYKKKEEKEKIKINEEINNTKSDLGSKEVLNQSRNKSSDKTKTLREIRIKKNNDISSSINSSNNDKNEKKNKKTINKLISKSTLDSNKINSIDKLDNNKIKNNSNNILNDSNKQKKISNSLISHDSKNITNRKNNEKKTNNTIKDNSDDNDEEEEEKEEEKKKEEEEKEEEKEKEKEKENEEEEEDGLIRLYFKFKDGNIIFIDVENYITFEKILNKLKEEYEWANIDDNNLFFDEKKIDKNDISKKLGITHGDYIDIESNLVG